ncbi:MAG: Phage/plasmid primase, family, C-terminal domain protein [Herminiimonas sp.]|nr:Phage/plasmid primase, family, C-terminal domain protein [Herminiimonas sp.]
MQLKPNPVEMKIFKDFFHPNQPARYQTYSKHEERRKESKHFSSKWTKKAKDRLIRANMNKMEIAMTINRTNGKGRSTQNITEIVALFVDCDHGTPSKNELLALPIPPHLIVETSRGNYHAYWLIKGCPVEQFKAVQQALAQKLGTDINVCDPGRAMRMPGTINWKSDPPFLAKIMHIQSDATPIPLARFLKKMGLTVNFLEDAPSTSGQAVISETAQQELTPQLKARIESALEGVPADDRWVWQRVGMAIHSADSTERGYEVWTSWSRQSEKFDAKDQHKRWSEFKASGGVNIESLFWLANHSKLGGDAAFDEMSMAELFAATYGHCLRYDSENKEWYHFAGVIWVPGEKAAHRLARQLISELTSGKKGNGNESLKRFRSVNAMKSVVTHAELLDDLKITVQAFDSSAHVLAVKNGVIDLTTSQFRTACASDYLRRQADVAFAPGAKCPLWIAFMKDVTRKDAGLYEFIRRALGYIVFGHADLQLFFLAVGSGGNGKGVLMRTIKAILGDYAQSVAPNLLSSAYSGNANSPSPALATLYGARFVICTELQTHRKMDDAFIKQYAGGDEITARTTYGEVFSFKPEGKLWLSANELPEIAASDEAMWRRLKPIPFDVKFQGAQRDDDLEKKFRDEYPGILNWILKGGKKFAKDGLGSCAAVDTLEGKMRAASDSVLAWMSECCIEESIDETQASLAYESYAVFCRKSRRKAMSPTAFRAVMEEKGFQRKKKRSNNVYLGFRLQG